MTTVVEHPIRLWGGIIVLMGAALGTVWAVFQRLETYDIALLNIQDQVQQFERRLEQENEDWWNDDKEQHAEVTRKLDQIFEAVVDVGADMQYSLGEHAGRHHSEQPEE